MPIRKGPRPWPDCESSCGHEIPTSRLGHSTKAWWACGTALEAFEKIEEDVGKVLTNLNVEATEIYYRVYMIGKTKTASWPVIWIFCKNSAVRRNAKEALRSSELMQQNGAFGLGSDAFPLEQPDHPRLLACLIPDDQVSNHGPDVFALSRSPAIGRPLFIAQGMANDAPQHATAGVVVQAKRRYYQVTAGHFFDINANKSDPLPSSDDDGCSFDGQAEDEEDTEMYSSYELSVTGKGSMTTLDQLASSSARESGTEQSDTNTIEQAWNAVFSSQSPHSTRTPESVPASSEPDLSRSGMMKIGNIAFNSFSGPSAALDYALVSIDSPRDGERINKIAYRHNSKLNIARVSQIGSQDTRVLATTSSNGVIGGILVPGTTTLIGSKSAVPQKLVAIYLDGVITEGDCGSVVVDENTGDLYGHIVRGCSGSRVAYLVAAIDVFRDAASQLGCKVVLCSAKRKTKTRSSEEYSQLIYSRSRQSAFPSSLSEAHYGSLAEWLRRPTPRLYPDRYTLAVLHELKASGDRGVTLMSQNEITAFSSLPVPDDEGGQVLFLRGYLPPSWVAELGSRYQIDPEFFRRHMDFLQHSEHHHRPVAIWPSLIDDKVIRLTVNTICVTEEVPIHSKRSLNNRRRISWDELKAYEAHLRRSGNTGDSIVRDYVLLDSRHAVIEQQISILVQPSKKSWIVLVWMDNGRSLSESSCGPWNSRARFLPVLHSHNILERPDLLNAAITPIITSESPGNPVLGSDMALHPLAQTTVTLPLEYQTLLSADRQCKDGVSNPFDALRPIFTHAASSEMAFLDLMSRKILEYLSEDASGHDYLDKVSGYESILLRHADSLRQCVKSVRNLRDKYGPRHIRTQSSPDQTQSESSQRRRAHKRMKGASKDKVEFRNDLLQDFESLLEACCRLQSQLSTVSALKANQCAVLDAQRTLDQSRSITVFTMVTLFFLPLSFVSSLFGMNAAEFNNEGLVSLGLFFAICIPVMAVTIMLWYGLRGGWYGKLQRRLQEKVKLL